MNCTDWEERIALSAGADLDPAAEAGVKRHLEECAACRGFAKGIEDSLALLRTAHQEPIAASHYTAIRAGVLARLERERRPWRRWLWVPALAAGLAVAVLFVAMRPAKKLAVAVAPARKSELPAVVARTVEPVAPRPLEPRRRVGRAAAPRSRQPVEPLVVKLLTNDPDVVIYWIADKKGDAR
jgi:hypothetical protein